MATEPETLDFDDLLSRTRIFAELLAIYLRSSPRIQEAIREMAAMANDESLAPGDRESAYAAVAGALLASAPGHVAVARAEIRQPPNRHGRAAREREQAVFGRRLKEKRVAKKLKQQELAELAGVRQSAISMMENGQCRPQGTTLARLAAVLGVEKNDLWPVREASSNANGSPPKTRPARKDRSARPR